MKLVNFFILLWLMANMEASRATKTTKRPKRDKTRHAAKCEERERGRGKKERDQPSCLLIKQPRGEALSPSVKAELR